MKPTPGDTAPADADKAPSDPTEDTASKPDSAKP
jgi:hypothetical protein